MKPAKEWVNDHTQSGAFDCVESCASAEVLVKAIQSDALWHAAMLVHDMSRGPTSDDRARAIHEARNVLADAADGVTAEPEDAQVYACANEACGWRGALAACVTPKHVPTSLLCPECYEVVEAGD